MVGRRAGARGPGRELGSEAERAVRELTADVGDDELDGD